MLYLGCVACRVTLPATTIFFKCRCDTLLSVYLRHWGSITMAMDGAPRLEKATIKTYTPHKACRQLTKYFL